MLLQSRQISGAQILSLHTGRPIAQVNEPIINPHNLEVVGFYVANPRSRQQPLVLLSNDVRDIAPKKVLVNSADELTAATDLVRLQDTLKIRFSLLGKLVKTTSKRRLGRVEEYVIDTESNLVQKIYVKQSLLKSLAVNSLVIDRQQIVEVTDRQITVSDATVAKPAVAPQRVV